MTTTNSPIPSAARLTEIEQRLNALGDVSGWHSVTIERTQEMRLYLGGILGSYLPILDAYDDPNDADRALLAFLGDAPHAIRDLLALIAQIRKLTNSMLLPSEQVLAIRELLGEGQNHA